MISILVPVYDEAVRIVTSLEQIFTFMDASGRDYEVVVVDDGSRDDTVDIVRQGFGGRPTLRIESYGVNRGKGYAVRYGIERARGEVVLFSDADLSTPIEELDKLQVPLETGADIVIGTRAHPLSDVRKRQPLYRDRAGKLFNLLVRLLLLPDLHDTQCGFKLLRRARILPLLKDMRVDRFAFDVELLYLARRGGLLIAEVPVMWADMPNSKVRFGQAAAAFVDVVRIRFWHGSGRK